ncbi:MAG: Sua5/YciO/YrdC/YwlC family protein [Planctomycetes bacterium]|nr:Sua5/YciO/YrdC/YwlC family protein [Planctomycetota bacterium]MCH9728026.1 Sua5/YciO/YrdC/YwlC family protein [Planctomycetota bacterium]MCH9775828.1 Sua5/YciO/YrdC/YwlC family protein [Planctomycetota bacterium]MDF1744668.1 Sua5/YciO/YrdC/YwlC family protein [Gimesia sp.]
MTERINLKQTDDIRDVIHLAVQYLAKGELVAFPTATAYVIAGQSLSSSAMTKLRALTKAEEPLVLCVKGFDEAFDYLPNMPPIGRKLSKRCWPGPVILDLERPGPDTLFSQLPAEVQSQICPETRIRLRAPAHEIIFQIMRLSPSPLVLLNEQSKYQTADDIMEDFKDQVALVIDDGPSRFGDQSTIVSISNNDWSILQPGVVTEITLKRLTSEIYMFVCTGNTCRSPMAEGLFRNLLSDKLGCQEDELTDQGFIVGSAGLAAASGAPPSPEGVTILAEQGIDIRSHESQPLTERLLDQTDHLYTMTQGHRAAILAERPDLEDSVKLLSPEGKDVSDPIGGGFQCYVDCKKEIEKYLRQLVSQINVH